VTLGEVLAESTGALEEQGIDTARLDAELLVGKALDATRLQLYLDSERELTGDELAAVRTLVERRSRREPVAYILGEWGFRRLTLKVDRRVLVPRPETEVVVERCLALLRGLDSPAVLDVGTGSGAIALAIADEHPGARVTAIDVSDDALALARENAAATGLTVVFERRDLRDGFAGSYDLVVSNPPYVTLEEIEGLEPEVRDWEPRLATVGEEHTELIARAAREALPNGWLVLEVADGRGPSVAGLLEELGYENVQASPDLAGRDRAVEGQWRASPKQ
jgi:release factor glutamine methyltransferase